MYNYLFVQPEALLLTAPATGEALSIGERQKWKGPQKNRAVFLSFFSLCLTDLDV